MTLKAQMQADIASVFFNPDEFAVPAVYTSADGSIDEKDIFAIIDYNTDLSGTDFGAAGTAVIRFKVADVPRAAVYDTITAEGTVFTVQSTFDRTGGICAVMCEFDPRSAPA